MQDTYFTLKNSSEALYKDKGSKFLSFAFHVETLEDVEAYVTEFGKRFYDARHVCYAYMLGAERLIFRAHDDGEPSSTAGKPILGQINAHDLTGVLILVVRYFGGILLGTGGLIKAYKSAALLAIEAGTVEECILEHDYQLSFPYEALKMVQRLALDFNLEPSSQDFNLECTFVYSLRLALEEAFLLRLEGLNYEGKIKVERLGVPQDETTTETKS